ncbi:secretin N-terminal domain-containing protein [Pseudomonas sp. NCCP-436]|uniref:secretin N-terminal domain-containing protein n=1 Tax=Pseudomonas sp. NCCP-436 TaxID=2842481 RepID=UPI001C7F2B6D|nr:secretin N-terminal domain-containing protein [Pseudomonas sp. NCCP-436]GIZ13037.1 hypothetical protein NCCP436_24530 [Pseudomonas sp. NCCP-436]
MKPSVFLTALILSLPLQAATEVIPLNYRMADEVLGAVQTLLGSDGRVSAYGNQLIVHAEPRKIEEVRELLQQLDSRPRRLLITLESTDDNIRNDTGYRVDGTLSAGDVDVRIGHGEAHGRDQLRVIRRSTDSRGGGTQQIQATEGYPALIQIGQSVPLTTTSTGPYGQVQHSTQYQNVMRGFYVTATLTGEQVHLNISSQNNRLSQSRPGVVAVQTADTRVSGRLGEWISLGGVSEQSSSSSSDLLSRHNTQGRDSTSLRLKVEALD